MFYPFTYPLIVTDANREALARIRAEAERMYDQPINALSYHTFHLFRTAGSRGEYESEYFEHRRLLCIYSAMALLKEDPKWLAKLCDVIWAVCDEYMWAVPAHITRCPTPEERTTRIDLFAAETACAIASLYHIFGDNLPAEVRDRMRYELMRRIVEPYRQNPTRWPVNNWSGVCVFGVCDAITCLDRRDIFEECLPAMERSAADFLASFGEDGCCMEGSLYWSYGFSFFCYFADRVFRYTDGRINYFADPKVEKIARFGAHTYLGKDDCVLPFSDAPHTYKYDPGLWQILMERFEGIVPPPPSCASAFGDDLRYRFAPFIRSLYAPHPDLPQPQDGWIYYESAQWYINKSRSYTFAAKAGHNAEPHNHNDVGSFVLFDRGNYILDDVGFPMYYAGYFGPDRYKDMCASSLGHSVPTADGCAQTAGEACAGKVLAADGDCFTAEIAPAYGNSRLTSLRRSFTLEDRGIRLRDSAVGAPISERFVTEIPPQILPDGAVRIGGYTLRCSAGAPQITTFTYLSRFAEFDENEKDPHTVYILAYPEAEEAEVSVMKETES